MKAFLLLALFAASLFLAACDTTVVARRPIAHRRVVYSGRVSDDRVIYRRYDDNVAYRTRVHTNRDFPRRSLDRTYAF